MAEFRIYEKGVYDSEKIRQHLLETSDYFIPSTCQRVNIDEWSKKLALNATIIELTDNGRIVGIGAFYFNQFPMDSYGTHICVLKQYQKEMYGILMLEKMIEYTEENGSNGFRCEIRKSNKPLVKYYLSMGFIIEKEISVDNSDEIDLMIYKKF